MKKCKFNINLWSPAIIAMAERGVGPYTATWILIKPFRNDDEFILEILRAEREYAGIYLFWDN